MYHSVLVRNLHCLVVNSLNLIGIGVYIEEDYITKTGLV